MFQPNYDELEKIVNDAKKIQIEAKLKAKGITSEQGTPNSNSRPCKLYLTLLILCLYCLQTRTIKKEMVDYMSVGYCYREIYWNTKFYGREPDVSSSESLNPAEHLFTKVLFTLLVSMIVSFTARYPEEREPKSITRWNHEKSEVRHRHPWKWNPSVSTDHTGALNSFCQTMERCISQGMSWCKIAPLYDVSF